MYNSYQLSPADFPGSVLVTDRFQRYPALVTPDGEQVCLTCNGRGTITDYRTEDGWSRFPQTVACHDCDGPRSRTVDVNILNPDGERVETEFCGIDADDTMAGVVQSVWENLMPGEWPGIQSSRKLDFGWGVTFALNNGFSVVVESDWRIEQALWGV